MKKLILALTMVLTLAFSGICMASNGSDLDKQLNVAEPLVASFSDKAPAYAKVAQGFDAELLKTMNEETFNALKNDTKANLGDLENMEFFSYQRFDNNDMIVYIATFKNNKAASVVVLFNNKNNKIVQFAIQPIKDGDTINNGTVEEAK